MREEGTTMRDETLDVFCFFTQRREECVSENGAPSESHEGTAMQHCHILRTYYYTIISIVVGSSLNDVYSTFGTNCRRINVVSVGTGS